MVSAVEATLEGLLPTAFVAMAVNVYVVPGARPVMLVTVGEVEPPTVTCCPPGLAVIV